MTRIYFSICLGVNSGDGWQAGAMMKTPKHGLSVRVEKRGRSILISGCEVHPAKAGEDINRHAANRELHRRKAFEMLPASNATSLSIVESWVGLAKRTNRLIAPRVLGSNHMGRSDTAAT